MAWSQLHIYVSPHLRSGKLAGNLNIVNYVTNMIAATTSRIGIFPDVANLPLRPPAVMAKAAASLDLLSGGCFELGLGAGGFWDAIEAYGASEGVLRGPVDQWVDELSDLVVTHGFDTFILWAEGEGQLSRFAGQVAPAVRARVAAERT
ncbi:MAG TPA: LLM class flavin-dependent oxidoreductase [Anaerolineales bacterium]